MASGPGQPAARASNQAQRASPAELVVVVRLERAGPQAEAGVMREAKEEIPGAPLVATPLAVRHRLRAAWQLPAMEVAKSREAKVGRAVKVAARAPMGAERAALLALGKLVARAVTNNPSSSHIAFRA